MKNTKPVLPSAVEKCPKELLQELLADKNMTNDDLLKKLDISHWALRKLRDFYGIKREFPPSIQSQISRDTLVGLFARKDMTSKEIAVFLGVEYSKLNYLMTVYRLRKEARGRKRYGKSVDEGYFEKIDTEEKSYWLGWLYSDGNIARNLGSFKLQLAAQDSYIIERFKKCLRAEQSIQVKPASGNIQAKYGLCVGSKKMANDLVSLGMHPAKSLTCKFPSIEQVSRSMFWAFVRGYVEGDGCLTWAKSKGARRASVTISVSYEFGVKFVEILGERFGIRAGLNKTASKIHVVYITGRKNVLSFLNKMYENCGELYLIRKYDKYLAIKECKKSKSDDHIGVSFL